MSEPAWDSEEVKVLFEVLFDMRALLARIVEFLEGGEDDGEEEDENANEP